MNSSKIIITLTVFLLTISMKAQTNPVVTKPESGQTSYIVDDESGIVNLEASSEINLLKGTWIKPGAIFSAKIVDPDLVPFPYSPITLSNENYILTYSFEKAMTTFNPATTSTLFESDVLEDLTYFDGLGRPMQQLALKASNNRKDIITHFEYDAYGRKEREFLPYEANTGTLGAFRTNAETATNSYYLSNYANDLDSADPNPFSQKAFEASPLNRVLKQATPGEDWKLGSGHEIQMEYQTNLANEVRRFSITFNNNNTEDPLLSGGNSFYAAGELYKNVTKDENWTSGNDHTTEEFTDKLGRMVLRRSYNESAYDTYYVYDDFDNLTFVIPPKVTTDNVSADELNQLCYQYRYDYRNRLIESKLPGKGTANDWESIVYNKLDQPIMAQDPNLKAQGKWVFTKYDAFGRIVLTGLATGGTRAQEQATANGYSGEIWLKNGNSTIEGKSVAYTNSAYPPSANYEELFTVNYYDDYSNTEGLSAPPASIQGQPRATNTTGLPTVSTVKVLDVTPEQWLVNLTAYDEKGRPIYTHSKNTFLGTEDITETKLDFAGKPILMKATHKKSGKSDIVTIDELNYDHAARLQRQQQQLAGQTELLAFNNYDGLGLLAQKKVGNTISNPLQQIDFSYNIKGWLKGINDINSVNGDLFRFALKHNDIGDPSKKLYNGNIAQTLWTSASSNSGNTLVSTNYVFTYDALNRLIAATDDTGNYNLEDITYDKNGNLLTLKRHGQTNSSFSNPTFGIMDDLHYQYIGNQLKIISDIAASETQGFRDDESAPIIESGIDYNFDANGNLNADSNKKIRSTLYNHLNLPTFIEINLSIDKKVTYYYAADGTKLRKITVDGGEVITTDYAGNFIYKDIGLGTELQFFNTSEGYVQPNNGSGYSYIYNYQDHLGNIRLSYTDADGNGTIDPATEIIEENNYYPFGLKHKGYNRITSALGNDTAKKFKYNGTEYEEALQLNLYEMVARQYDPAIGRFTAIDPVVHHSQSTYTAFDNNPVFWSDPSGADSGTDGWAGFGRLGNDYGIYSGNLDGGSPNKNNDGDCCDPWRTDQYNELEGFTGTQYTNNPVNFENRTYLYGIVGAQHLLNPEQYHNWDSSFNGNLQDYNQQNGTNYSTSREAMAGYTYHFHYARIQAEHIRSIHEATRKAAEYISYILPTGIPGGASLAKGGFGLWKISSKGFAGLRVGRTHLGVGYKELRGVSLRWGDDFGRTFGLDFHKLSNIGYKFHGHYAQKGVSSLSKHIDVFKFYQQAGHKGVKQLLNYPVSKKSKAILQQSIKRGLNQTIH